MLKSIDILKLNENKLSSITQFLKIIVEEYKSYGVILWELNSKIDCLFIAAHWFPNDVSPIMHALSAAKSNTGLAIKSSETIYIQNISESPLIESDSTFWDHLNIKSFLSIPLKFENGELGALNIYCTNENGFPLKVQEEFELYASILPCWYNSLQERATHALINKTDSVLKIAEVSYAETPISKDDIKLHFKNLCKHISDTFQAFETSIFLKDPFTSNDEYECVASTWPIVENIITYKAKVTDGITGWILEKKTPVYISDLLLFKNEQQGEIIRKQYPEICWSEKTDIITAVAERLGVHLSERNTLPPMGFIGAPICIGDKILGMIRCCAPLKSPYYFGPQQLSLLRLNATRIGEVWNNWIQRVLIQEDTDTWRKIIESTNRLDGIVLTELAKQYPNKDNIFESVLKELPLLIKDAEILDLRLVDPQKNELYFASKHGAAWEKGTVEEIKARKERRFPLDGETPMSAGADVFRNKKVIEYNRNDNKNIPYNGTFNETQKMIIVPVFIRNEVLGVLDVRSTKLRPFQRTAKHAVELMAGQLAVYHELLNAVSELQSIRLIQIETFQDFTHQFRSPILQATKRSRLALRDINNTFITPTLIKNLNATAGLCNKANRVTNNLRLFADLSKNEPLHLEKTPITTNIMTKLISEATADNKVMIKPTRNIKISFEKEAFFVIDNLTIEFDQNMLEQLINVLLDNAIKYSYDNTEVKITGSLTIKNQFQLSFTNFGIPISEAEVKECKKRGWRSESAKLTTGEGGGIGLWILDNIMTAHGGSLIIHPTNKNGLTEVKTIFSNKK